MTPTLHIAEAYLSQKYPMAVLKKILIPRAAWKPFPTSAEREAWEALPESIRKVHICQGEQALQQEWPHLRATNYLQFARNGNRDQYERSYFLRREILTALLVAECLENKGRFLDPILDAVWSICEESSWVMPAHMYIQGVSGLPDTGNPVVDLFCGETAALLAWTAYLVGPQLQQISPLILPRIHRELDARILTPDLEREDFWWMGFRPIKVNNWNPWVNSNWLITTLLMETDEDRRVASVHKILRSLDRFLVSYPQDGGCDEGPGYWGRAGASVYDNLALLFSATGGRLDEFNEPLIQEIGRYIYRAHIAGQYFLNFADASAVLLPDPALVHNFGRRIGDEAMSSFGAWLAQQGDLVQQGFRSDNRLPPSLGRLLPAFFSLHAIAQTPAKPPLLRDVFLNQIQVMAARDQAGSSKGLYVAAKGGHNNESHNHNDVGNFVVYIDGKPLIIDIGVETYTRKTFSPQRYEIWTMQSAYHSLPTINGVMQAPGESYAARNVACFADDSTACFSLDIAAAYPPEAKVKRWQRTILLKRQQSVLIEDAFELEDQPCELSLSLMTPCKVDASRPGLLRLEPAHMAGELISGAGELAYHPAQLDVVVERINITDQRLVSVWGSQLHRLLLRPRQLRAADTWQITLKP